MTASYIEILKFSSTHLLDVEIDRSNEQIFVTALDHVKVYDKNGVFVRSFGSEHLWNIEGIAMNHDTRDVYVADYGYDSVVQFTSDGVYIRQFGSSGGAPTGIGVDSEGYVYVVHWWTSMCRKYTSEGEFIKEWDIGSIYNNSVDCDSEGNVYISIEAAYINKYTSEGVFITQWGRTSSRESGVAVDLDDNVFVNDYYGIITKYTSDGEFIITVTNVGIHGRGVDVGNDGKVYAAEAYPGYQIHVYDFWEQKEILQPASGKAIGIETQYVRNGDKIISLPGDKAIPLKVIDDVELDDIVAIIPEKSGGKIAHRLYRPSLVSHPILKSDDNGATWSYAGRVGDLDWVNCLVDLGGGRVLAGCKSHVYISTNYGKSWKSGQSFGMNDTPIDCFLNLGGGEVLLGAFCSTYPYEGHVWKSYDNGDTWEHKHGFGAWTDRVMAFVNLGSGIILAGGGYSMGMAKSTDSGENWTGIGGVGYGVHWFVNYGGGVVRTASEQGGHGDIYRSDDFGDSWTPESCGTQPEGILDLGGGVAIGAGWQFLGARAIKTVDNYLTWNSVQFMEAVQYPYFSPIIDVGTHIVTYVHYSPHHSPGKQYSVTIIKSTNDGDSWTQILDLPGMDSPGEYQCFIKLDSGRLLFCGYAPVPFGTRRPHPVF